MGFTGSSAGKESGDRFDFWDRKICWRWHRLPTPVFLGFPGGSDGKESTYSIGCEDPQRRAWQPTLVFLPGESPQKESIGHRESIGHGEADTAKRLSTTEHKTH